MPDFLLDAVTRRSALGAAMLPVAAFASARVPAKMAGNAALARNYIEAVGRKEFDRVASMLTPGVSFSTPDGADINGSAGYLAALRHLAPILVRNDVKRVFVDGEEGCIVYDFVTDTPVGAVPSVEWLTFDKGRIGAVRLIFHSAPWPRVLAALKARAR